MQVSELARWITSVFEHIRKAFVRSLCPPHTPKAVTYHEQSHYCRFMIGHSLGRMDISFFLPHFRLYEVRFTCVFFHTNAVKHLKCCSL